MIARSANLTRLKMPNKRKAVIIDFFNGISLWAQYAEGHVPRLSEWEISADDYRSLKKPVRNTESILRAPRSAQILPTQCENCIEATGISISIQNPFR